MPSTESSQRDPRLYGVWSQSGSDGATGPRIWNETLNVLRKQTLKTWSRTSNFRQLKKSGAYLPPQPFDYSRGDWTGQCAGTVSYSVPGYNWTQSGSGPLRMSFPFISASYDPPTLIPDSVVLNKALERMRSRRWQAPVAFIEAAKTETMIANRIVGLASAARQLRRGNLPGFLHSLDLPSPSNSKKKKFNSSFGKDARKAGSNAWLEYQYGWLPTLSDAKSAAELLADVVTRPRNRTSSVTVSAFATQKSDSTDSWAMSPYWTGIMNRHTLVKESKRLTGRFVVKDDLLNTASLLSLTNPLEVAWELVPFSFVVDWFLPIGDFLSNISALHGIDFQHYSIGQRMEYQYFTDGYRIPNPGVNYSTSAAGYGEFHLLKVNRRVFAGNPPNPLPRFVDFSRSFESGTRIGNALALLSQQIGGFRR